MLVAIKQTINDLPDQSFADFYQDYVVSSQLNALEHEFNVARSAYTQLDDVNQIMKGLDILTEELKY